MPRVGGRAWGICADLKSRALSTRLKEASPGEGKGERGEGEKADKEGWRQTGVSIPDGIWAQGLCHSRTLKNRRGQNLPHRGCSDTALQTSSS